MRIVETKSPPFNDTVRLNSSEKLKPVFSLLNQILGVSGSSAPSKQGGEDEVKVKEGIHQKDNVASVSKKDNGKGIDEDNEEEN